ncbi:MAG: hypothetical protein KC613_09705, partial [Myxococcales bacterium]|nr:hypothetical protein [Myxococcales bacterium]
TEGAVDDDELEDGARYLSPTRPPEEVVPGPTAEMAPETDRLPPEARWRARQGKQGLRTARRALVLGLLLGAIVGGAALIPVPRQITLKGRLTAPNTQDVRATVRGRVDHLAKQAGELVAAGEVVVRLVDLDAKADVEQLTAAIAALEAEAKDPKAIVRPGVASPALLQRLSAAERALDQARQHRKAVLSAFNRRELGLAALEAARAQEATADRTVQQLRQQIRTEQARQEVVTQPPDAALLQRIGELVARKEKLAAELRVTVTAPRGGLLGPVGGQPDLQTGGEVAAGDPLFVIIDVDTLAVALELDGAQLDALGDERMVTVVPRGLPEPRAYEARLDAPVPTGEGTWRVRGHIANPGHVLRPGQGVHVELDLPAGNMLGRARDWILGRGE